MPDQTTSSHDDAINLHDLLNFLQVLADNVRLLVFGPLVVGVLTLAYTFWLPPIFTATTKFLPPQQQSTASSMLQSLGALGGLAGAAGGLKNPTDQYIGFLQSRTLQDALIDRFKQAGRYDQPVREDARRVLEASSVFYSGKEGFITIEVDDQNPAFAAELANAYVDELARLLNRMALTEAQQRRVFFESQLASTKNKLVLAEQALKSSGVNASALKANPATAVEGLARLKAAVTAQEIKLASMRGYLTDAAPDFKQAQTELAALRAQLNRAERQEPEISFSEIDSDYIARFREFKYQETLFELFAKQYEIARVDESRDGAVIQVIDVAVPPERKSKPQKAKITVTATLIAGVLILLFVLIRHALRKAGQDQDINNRFTRIKAALQMRHFSSK